jgi:hypothetical protein
MSAAAPDEALLLYRESLDALSEQREQITEDLKFSDPSNPEQWTDKERKAREGDPGGSRPCLVFDQCQQYVANVAGQIEQRPPSIHAIPVSEGASQQSAEQLDGMLRYIEYASRAQTHYTRALTSAARVGVGYITVRPQYVDRALNLQEPRIASEGDPLRVVIDPWSQEIDGSDATFGFVLSPMSHASFERQWGTKAEKHSFGDEQIVIDRDQEIVVAEYWRVETVQRDMVAVTYDERGDFGALTVEEFKKAIEGGEQITPMREYKDKVRRVLWSVMSGAEPLVKEREFPSDSIGIVPVYGYVGWANGRMNYCGIPRRARDAQKAYNYHMSEIRAFMSQAPKAPWIVPVRAINGLKYLWDLASVESRAYLPYHDIDELGQPIAEPKRAPLAINLANHTQGAEAARMDIQAAIGMYQANLGAPSNETSGIAINERKQQGEASTAHFPSHLQASLTQVGRVCVDMIPRLIDSRRQLRVMSIDGKTSGIAADPKANKGYSDEGGKITINPSVGRYDVRVVVGGNFATQRQQAQQAYTEMIRANPQMMPAIAPLWAQTLDVPHADKLAQVLTAMAPDAVKAILQPNEAEDTAALKQENDQLKAALQEATQLAHEAQSDADEAEAKCRELESKHEAEEDKNAISAYDAQTKRMQALSAAIPPEQVGALVQQSIQELLDAPSPWPGEAATTQNEQVKPAEPAEPAGPSPELQAILEQIQALSAAHQESRGEMAELAKKMSQPRKRIPIRDAGGNILHVLEMTEGQANEVPLQ